MKQLVASLILFAALNGIIVPSIVLSFKRRRDWLSLDAKIVDTTNDGETTRPVLEYSYNGVQRVVSYMGVIIGLDSFQKGGTVTLLIDPHEPEKIEIYRENSNLMMIAAIGSVDLYMIHKGASWLAADTFHH